MFVNKKYYISIQTETNKQTKEMKPAVAYSETLGHRSHSTGHRIQL